MATDTAPSTRALTTTARVGADERSRCWWPGDDAAYVAYHDDEWGRPVTSDRHLFEKVCLEGFQAGLSWITILRKREAFREAFAGFDLDTVAGFGDGHVTRMLGNVSIVRHEGKIRSTINNAGRAQELRDEFGSLAAYFWQWRDDSPAPVGAESLHALTEGSKQLSRDLKRRGWSFVGPTTMYAFLQSVGIVNDHVAGCEWHEICEAERAAVQPTR